MAMKQLMSIFMSAEIWDWTFQCPDVQKVPSFKKKIYKHVFQETWICGFIVVWGGVLPGGMWPHNEEQMWTFFVI